MQATTWSTQPNNEELVQVRLEVILLVPAGCDSTAYHTDIRDSFIKSYQKERIFLYVSARAWYWTVAFRGSRDVYKNLQIEGIRERIRNILLTVTSDWDFHLLKTKHSVNI